MRTPTSWHDRDLLLDHPFATWFFAANEGGLPRGQDWCKDLMKEFEETPDLRTVAERWIAYAFVPEAGTPASRFLDASRQGKNTDLFHIFIRFYWAWYRDDSGCSAMKVVNDERKTRGYTYQLHSMPSVCVQAVDHRGSMASVTASESTSEHHVGDAAPSAIMANSASGTHCSNHVISSLAGIGHFDSNSAHDHLSPSLETITAYELASPIDDQENSASHRGRVSSIHPGHGTDLSASEAETSSTQRRIGLGQSREHTLATIGGSGSTSLEPLVVQHISPPEEGQPPKKRKKQCEDHPPIPARQFAPRTGAKLEQLSFLVQREAEHHDRMKRGFGDDDDYPNTVPSVKTPNASKGEGSALTRKKSKEFTPRSRAQDIPDATLPFIPEAASPHVPESLSPVALGVPTVLDTGTASVSGVEQNQRVLSRRGKKGKTSAGPKKLKKPGDSRPTKRRRGQDKAINAIDALNVAMTQQSRPCPETAPEGTPVPLAEDASLPKAINIGRRTQSQTQTRSMPPPATKSQGPPAAARKIAKLPKMSARKRLADIAPLAHSTATLGIPANLPEADRILHQAAFTASLILNNEVAKADDWTEDKVDQEIPPSSDDEEDIPLSLIVASKRADGVASSAQSAAFASTSMAPEVHRPLSPAPFASLPVSSSIPNRPTTSKPRLTRVVPTVASTKPPLPVRPTIWAESRQEVCESFDWFRSYQGGVYFNNDMVKGYLLSAFSSRRDIFARGGRLIISHGGGKAESIHNNNGRSELFEADDQREEDKSVRALLRTYHMKRPLVLIIDDRYALFPYDLAAKGYTYVVLGFYHIVHAWAEREPSSNGRGSVVRWKFAFEWCEKQPAPWWLSTESQAVSAAVHVTNRVSPTTYTCPSCSKPSPAVYENTWMCLQPACAAFWVQQAGAMPPEDLEYHSSFLNSSMQCDHERLEDLEPQPPATEAPDGVITSRRFCKGWHCKSCGRLSCRYKWEHWECQGCGATLQVSGINRSPKEFWSQTSGATFYHHKVADDAGIIVSMLQKYRVGNVTGDYHIYTLPENRGRIYLIAGNPCVNGKADHIFQSYQDEARSGELRFRRWPLRSHQCRGTLLTNYFSQNTGEPYQYVGGTANTVPFDDAPSAVVHARKLIQDRMVNVMQAEKEQCVFNEVLSAAYMEKQKMAFHSDAERGLGPRVASLSLGSAAYMHFRLLKKYRTDKGSGSNVNALTLLLRHGDVVIMDGAEIQEYYEHTVVPLNFRIAATARYIGAT